jgi:hypothetical protein
MFKIYVGNLDYKVKVEQLRELFSVLGPIEDLVIPTDPATNKPKGFAIVMIRDPEIGHAAIKAMQGKRLMGRALVVNEAVKKKKSAALPPKEQVIRNGPFGPRMNRFGDPRGNGGSRPNRNPRRAGPSMSRGPQSAPSGAPPRPVGERGSGGDASRPPPSSTSSTGSARSAGSAGSASSASSAGSPSSTGGPGSSASRIAPTGSAPTPSSSQRQPAPPSFAAGASGTAGLGAVVPPPTGAPRGLAAPSSGSPSRSLPDAGGPAGGSAAPTAPAVKPAAPSAAEPTAPAAPLRPKAQKLAAPRPANPSPSSDPPPAPPG